MTTVEEISALTRPNHPDDWTDVDSEAVDTVRVLAADAVQKVGNGHPGTAMSLAPLAYSLFQRQMRHDPSDVHWLGRDRFVLSCGHSSLTLYIQLYLGGFGLELSDIESLRTWKSKTPGHPEFRHTKGVEITTGPLGPGSGLGGRNGDGLALRARPVRPGRRAPGESPFDHYIYVIASDGDMEEGVTSEASSLAGTQQLGNLIVFYDHNQISIEHDTNIALSEDVPARYRAYGWHVQEVEGGENVVGIEQAIAEAKKVTDKPSFISVRTIIGYPAPDQDEHRRRARLGARRRGGGRHQARPRLRPGQDVRGARRGHRAHPQAGRPRQGSPREVAAAVRRMGRAGTRAQEAARPALRPRNCPTAGTPTSRTGSRAPRRSPPAPRSARCSTTSRRSCPSCGAAQPIWRAATTPPSRT